MGHRGVFNLHTLVRRRVQGEYCAQLYFIPLIIDHMIRSPLPFWLKSEDLAQRLASNIERVPYLSRSNKHFHIACVHCR